jgi:hypothetical protein
MNDRLLLARRYLLAVSVVAAAWALAIAQTGGGVVRLGGWRLSSRDPATPAVIALVCGLIVLALRAYPAARTTVRAEWAWWACPVRRGVRTLRHPFAPAVTIACAAAAIHLIYWLPATPLWVDEEMLALNLRDRSIAGLPGTLWLGQSAPLGWLIMQRVVLLILGTGELSLRLVPFAYGLAFVATAVWMGWRWMSPMAAALFVLLCGLGEWLSFFRFELKHYSADAFWALLLPALAAWALEEDAARPPRWRWVRWWAIAALGQWFSNGAVLVTPACALVLFGVILRRHGLKAAARFCAWGLLWLASFGAHYELALRHAHESRYLRTYWAMAVPPPSTDALSWIVDRIEPLAANPGGTSLAITLWLCVVCGFACTRRFTLAALFATVPLSAFALAALRLVPLHERLTLWVVPALYLGVALAFDAALRTAMQAWRPRRWLRLLHAAIVAGAALALTGDIVSQGYRRLASTPRDSNHGLDDRTAARWLMDRRQPGDAMLTTRLGWPALLWYGGIPLQPALRSGRFPDGTVMYEAALERARPGCREAMRALPGRHRRILVYVGFPDLPEDFYERLLGALAPVGRVVESQQFAHLSRTAVVDLHDPLPDADASPAQPDAPAARAVDVCVTLNSPSRW